MASNLDPSNEPLDEGAESFGNPFDQLFIAGLTFKDTSVQVTGPGRRHKYEKKTAKGASGGKQDYQGTDPTEFTVSWLLYTTEHFEAWAKLSAIIAPPDAKKQPAKIKVEHPRLAYLSVSGREFIVESVSPPDPAGPQQERVSIQITEAMAAKPAATKKAAGQQGPHTGEAVAAAQKVYDDLSKELVNTVDPIRQRQINVQQADIAKRYPTLKKTPAPSKNALKP